MSAKPSLPKLLHRYMGVPSDLTVPSERREWLEDLIAEHRFYFPSVIDFNDPFDGHPHILVSDQEAWIRKMFSQHSGDENPEAIEAEIQEILRQNIWHRPEILERYRQEFLNNVQYPLGVLSLSENLHSILMWSHYAEKHMGICLTFDGHSDFFRRAMKVTYQKAFPIVDLALPHDEIVQAALLVKSDAWEYEQEWRIIDENNGRVGKYQFPKETLLEVTFGDRMTPENEAAPQRLFVESFPHVKFFRMVVDTKDFRLDRIAV